MNNIHKERQGLLTQKLVESKSNNILYCDYYYFVLFIDNKYEFYFNPSHLFAVFEEFEMPKEVIGYLEDNCPKFINFYKHKHYDETKCADWKPNTKYYQNIPKIGNAYSFPMYKIITERDLDTNQKIIHLHQDYGPTLFANFTTIGEKEMQAFLTMSIFSETEKYIKTVYELDCFKQRKMKNVSKTIIGAIAGDIIGSVYEWNNVKTTEFALFTAKSKYTDDTVLTVAIADCIVNNKDFTKTVWEYGRKYRGRGYGGRFKEWLESENPQPYKSFGNGSAMRVSAVGFAYNDIETVLQKAKETAEITHNHSEGIKGAQATASAIFLAKVGKSKPEIKDFITTKFNYNLDFKIEQIRPTYTFDVTCQGSVPQAIVAFLESENYENAIRLAISIGGDSDTIACITGGIAAAFYKEIPESILDFATSKLPNEFIDILNEFDKQFINR